jgi:hypothetical protein
MRLATTILAALVALFAAIPSRAAARRCYVVDARLAALRSAPDLAAPLLKRLRTGRPLEVVGRRKDREGRVWLRVAVTRRTRGWIVEDATAAPGDACGEARLAARVASLEGIPRLEAARLAADRFPRLGGSASAAIEDEARLAADDLSERIARRLGPLDALTPSAVRALVLSDPALDRYNRLGVLFDVDPTTRRLVPRRRPNRPRSAP